MSIEKIVLNVATHYHANLIDIHNALHALGLRSDKQAEKFNKNIFKKFFIKGGTIMILFTLLVLTTILALVSIAILGAILGSAFIVVFGDVIVFVFLLVMIVKHFTGKKKRNK